LQPQEVVGRLRRLVMVLKDGNVSKRNFRQWANQRIEELSELFDYSHARPKITDLVGLSFHPTEPFILFNYTRTAHSRLHLYPNGWTDVIRQCRGIVFDSYGNLVALPWPKFFNFNGNVRTIPPGPFTATVKYDGHLGIIFEYKGRFYVTTRGEFASSTSVLAEGMLARYIKKFGWKPEDIWGTTLLVEILHPQTKVYLDYPEERFVLIGARSLHTLQDHPDERLLHLSQRLGIPLAERWQGSSVRELLETVSNPQQPGEGYVGRFANGEMLKFKCFGYVQRMVSDTMGKNPWAYVVRRLVDGDLKHKLPLLDEESVDFARKLAQRIRRTNRLPIPPKQRWQKLYTVAPSEFRTNGYKEACRELAKAKS